MIFQSTLPARGATRVFELGDIARRHFNPRSPHGERPLSHWKCCLRNLFQSTLPARGATEFDFTDIYTAEFQSTLPARGATEQHREETAELKISIHAPRTGSDSPISSDNIAAFRNFNPRSPHGERRRLWYYINVKRKISIHAPRTGSDLESLAHNDDNDISIHAPRTGSDMYALDSMSSNSIFQSTLPARGATSDMDRVPYGRIISIHAPRTGSDAHNRRKNHQRTDFNPRSPHGERPGSQEDGQRHDAFQSTLPARGATRPADGGCRRGGDFNPRSPHGERLDASHSSMRRFRFQSTLPARGAT